ncbi:hypothetical protein [Falsirhodobacter deserti]|uniref:hypothetical protein n=1 Tax=Falsirhodobacter deserti TaxID=1365611 RepID=UPI000FE3FE53|nr:hypothetical protein [Falsirhodobacter deserti]
MKILATAGALALAAATPALALEFEGGSVTLGYSVFNNDNDLSRAGLTGQLQFGIAPGFSVQTDLGVSKFFELGETEHDLTLHGIWHDGVADLGLFYGVERIAGDNKDFFGFEVGQKTQLFDVELYLGHGENFDNDGMLAGVAGRYAMTPAFGLGLSYDRADIDHLDMSRVALKADYAVQPNVSLGAEIGRFDADTDEAWGRETYFGLNATMTFGREQGATFGRRGVLNIIPGL